MTGRETVAQGLPPSTLDGFPARALSAGAVLFRAHHGDRSPWWFGNDGGGRFDLPAPQGTCYTALDATSAVRERLGPVLGSRAALPESTLAEVVVSRLRLPERRSAADLQSRGAAPFGVTRELETMVPYAVPQAWARAFAGAGFGAVSYGPRFTPGDCTAIALFGPEGLASWEGDPSPVGAQGIMSEMRIWPTPRRADLSVVRPPRTRAARG